MAPALSRFSLDWLPCFIVTWFVVVVRLEFVARFVSQVPHILHMYLPPYLVRFYAFCFFFPLQLSRQLHAEYVPLCPICFSSLPN